MNIIGYTDPMTVTPGETVAVKVSARSEYRAELVRLIHGDQNCNGPGFKTQTISTPVEGEYPGREQSIHVGSFITVPDAGPLQLPEGFTLAAWIYPTTPHNGTQGLLTKWNPVSHAGYGLFIDEKACLSLWIGDGRADHRFSNALPLRAAQWYFIAASYDGKSTAHLIQQPQSIWTRADSDAESTHRVSANPAKNDAPVIIAACASPDSTPFYYYNGKIESPAIYDTPLEDKELHQLRNHGTAALNRKPVAAWDFTRDFGTDLATEVSSNALHGRVVNMPARAMTGHAWNGERKSTLITHRINTARSISTMTTWKMSHGKPTSNWLFPRILKAVYMHFICAQQTRMRTMCRFWFVRPKARRMHRLPCSCLRHLTLAYGNENFRPSDTDLAPNQHPDISKDRYDYARQHQLRCCYDKHNDGSGVCYASRLRPIVDLRPDHRHGSIACPHGLSADLYLVGLV